MSRLHIAPLALALVWVAIAVIDVTTSSLSRLGPMVAILLVLLAVLSSWAAWRFRAWFQFSAVTRALFLLPFAWAVMVAFAATFQIAESIIPLVGGGHTLALAASVTLARSLVSALLVSLVVVAPLVIVYQRYAPVVAAVLCIPVIALEAHGWPMHTTHTITHWLIGAELALLVTALVGFGWLVSRKGMLSNLSLNPDASPAALARRPLGAG